MGYPEAWRFLVRPQIYEEAPGTSAPNSPETAGWAIHSKFVTATYSPAWTLVDDSYFEGSTTGSGSAITRNVTQDNRLISKEFRIDDLDWIFKWKMSMLSTSDNSSILRLGLVQDTRTFYSTAYPVINDIPHMIGLEYFQTGAGPTVTVVIKATDTDTVLTSASITVFTAVQDRWFKLERIGNTVKLSAYTDSNYITQVAGSPISLDITSVAANLDKLKYIQWGNYADGGGNFDFDSRISEMNFRPQEFFDISDTETTRLIDLSLNFTKNEVKDLKLAYDDVLDELQKIKVGDEILFWADNYTKNILTSWDMEYTDSAGKLIDYSGNGNVGAIIGATSTGITDVGKVEQALVFDAAADTVLSDLTLARLGVVDTDKFSIMGWVFTKTHDGASGVNVFTTSSAGHNIKINANRTVTYTVNLNGVDQSITGTKTVADSTWAHLALVWDGTNFFGYFNGVEDAKSASFAGQVITTGIQLRVKSTAATTWVGIIDEYMFFKEGIIANNIRSIFDISGRCTKLYFQGIIETMTRDQNEKVTMEASEGKGELAAKEVYDIIFEGHNLPSAVGGTGGKPALAHRTLDLETATIDATTRRIAKFTDVDGTVLSNENGGIEDIILGFTDQSTMFVDSLTTDIQLNDDATPAAGRAVRVSLSFTAQATQIDFVWIFGRFKLTGGAGGVLELHLCHNVQSTDAGLTGIPAGNGFTIPTFTVDTGGVFQWVKLDVDPVANPHTLTIGSKYWIQIETNSNSSGNPAVAPYSELRLDGSRPSEEQQTFVEREAAVTTKEYRIRNVPMTIVFSDVRAGMKEMDTEDYFINYDEAGAFWYADLTDESEALIQTFKGGVTASYIYSTGGVSTQKVKHVIEKLIRKTAIMKGAYSGRATDTNLGLYVPQGGTILEHIRNAAKISNSIAIVRTANVITVENGFTRSTMENGTMENAEGWEFSTNGATKFDNLGYSTTAPRTGAKHYRMEVNALALVIGDKCEIFQDIENWNGSLSVFWKATFATANMAFRVYTEPYGGGTRTQRATTTLDQTSYSRLKVSEASFPDQRFRLILTAEVTAGFTPGAAFFVDIDDVIQTQTGGIIFYGIKDGFAPATGVGASATAGLDPDQDTYSNIITIDKSGDLRRLTTMGISVSGSQSSRPIGGRRVRIAASKDMSNYDKFGPRIAVRQGGRVNKSLDRYNRAKGLIEKSYSDDITIKIHGMLPYLYGRSVYVLFPDLGIKEWTPYSITDVSITLDNTTLKATESTGGYAIQNMRERESEASVIESPLSDAFQHYIIADFSRQEQTTTQAYKARIQYAGATELISRRAQKPEADVRIFEWNRNQILSIAPASDTYTKFINLYDSADIFIGQVTLPYGDRFVKLANMTVNLIAFSRKRLLGQA